VAKFDVPVAGDFLRPTIRRKSQRVESSRRARAAGCRRWAPDLGHTGRAVPGQFLAPNRPDM